MATELIRRCDYVTGSKVCGKQIEGDKTVPFSYGGSDYEADLCTQHEEELTKRLEPFVAIAAKAKSVRASGRTVRGSLRGRPGQPFTTKQARQWLQENREDLNVPDTGRISEEHLQIFKAANNL